MFSRDFAYADHPYSIRRDGLVVEGGVHEDTGAGWWSLIAFGGHRVMGFQQGLETNEKNNLVLFNSCAKLWRTQPSVFEFLPESVAHSECEPVHAPPGFVG